MKKKTEAEEPTYFNDAIIKLTKTIRKKEMKNRLFSKIETALTFISWKDGKIARFMGKIS